MFGHRAHGNEPLQPLHWFLALAIVGLGLGLRLQSAGGDLWQDEIWSLNHAAAMTAWHEAFWKVIHDNNHPLNTLYLYLLGPDREPWLYRLSAVFAGGLSIIAAGWAVAHGRAPRLLLAMLLTAVLYPLVHFGSEARGYGSMILFAYLAFIAVDRSRNPTDGARWLFGLAVTLGALSHFSILPIVFAMSIAYGLGRLRSEKRFWTAVHDTLRFCAPASGGLAVIGALVIYGLQHSTQYWFGGRDSVCPDQGCFVGAVDEIIRFGTGGFGPETSGLHAGLFAILGFGAIVGLIFMGHRRALLYLAIFGGTPLIYKALGQPDVAYGRYFIGIFAFIPLLVADTIWELRMRSGFGRVLGAILVLALMAANTWGLMRFQDDKRGQYRAAYTLITETSTHAPLTIGSDQAFRVAMVFDYLKHKNGLQTKIVYTAPENIARDKPEWLILVMRQYGPARPEVCLTTSDAAPTAVLYELVKTFAHWGLAGADWDVYRRIEQPLTACP